MNHGKKNNQSKLDKANEFIARLLGKKSQNSKINEQQQPAKNSAKRNDLTFICVFFGVAALIWSLTGVCYVPEDSYGVITQNGKVKKVLNEKTFILTYPYPINDFNTFNLEGNKIDFGTNESSQSFSTITQDSMLVKTSIVFNIDITNPKQFYLNFYQIDKNSLNRVKLISASTISQYFNHHTYHELQEQNKIVSANELASNLNSAFINYGITVSKLNLADIDLINSQESESVQFNKINLLQPTNSLIVQQAYQYKQFRESQLNDMLNDYYGLLKQYNTNPQLVTELLYYRALANNNKQLFIESDFTLLDLTESAYLSNQIHKQPSVDDNTVRGLRNVNRDVVRERTLSNE